LIEIHKKDNSYYSGILIKMFSKIKHFLRTHVLRTPVKTTKIYFSWNPHLAQYKKIKVLHSYILTQPYKIVGGFIFTGCKEVGYPYERTVVYNKNRMNKYK